MSSQLSYKQEKLFFIASCCCLFQGATWKICAIVKMVPAARWALFEKITLFIQGLLFSLMHIEARVKNNSGLLMSHLTHDWMPIKHAFHKPIVKVINASNWVYLT